MGQGGVSPTDAEMVALGEELVEAARQFRGLTGRLRAAIEAWDDAMIDQFMSAIETMGPERGFDGC